ncbi:MAG TPA: patatin-like phospholipase family protein [Solirubrobacteraceae bacterium]|jgi:hypothetical protein|nr:patatin-like phospholipase family protein [Solirubrobacteraceae bacterium]
MQATDALVEQLREVERRREGREDRPIRILAVDGGGIRGLIPARVLAELEDRTGRRMAECFDLIAGTSTGGIIAAALAVPEPGTDHPRWSAQTLVDLYTNRGGDIFHRPWWRALLEWMIAKYSPRGLDRILADKLGDATLRDAVTEVLLTSWDLSNDDPRYFSSVSDPDVPMRIAARATSAAPTYFPPLWFGEPERRALVDGGVFANDPARLAWMAKRSPGGDPALAPVLVSLGTGSAKSPDPSKRRFWGTLPWARPMIDLLLTAPSDLVERELRDAADQRQLKYFRLNPRSLGAASPRLDDVSPENIRALDAVATELIRTEQRQLDEIAALL